MAAPRGEVRERHPVGAADPGVQMVNLASKSIRREPLGHCIGIEERPIDSFGCCTEHAMEPDGVCLHVDCSCELANVIGIADGWAVMPRHPRHNDSHWR